VVPVRLEDWHEVLASEPTTSNQRGAIMREFGRLGFGEDDRAARLAASAALLELDELDTTSDLTMGQAGQLIRVLRQYAHRGELPEASSAVTAGSAGAPARPGGGMRLSELVRTLTVAYARLWLSARPDEHRSKDGDGSEPGPGAAVGKP
jgi:hypothetical protein